MTSTPWKGALFAALMLAGTPPLLAQEAAPSADPYADRDAAVDFIRVILAATEDVWAAAFEAGSFVSLGQRRDQRYAPPITNAYDHAVSSACGPILSEYGPQYCEQDSMIYFDPSFFQTMSIRHQAPGDFGYAYVIAHETTHHVQKSLGILEASNARAAARPETANSESIRVELQADCLAGVWSKAVVTRFKVDDADVREALNAVLAFGVDTMQRREQGFTSPETYTHGTSAQRLRWFQRGFDSSNPARCDTFSVAAL
ncbi:MAG: neutral zinc metallopeptidase [Hyphomonadaceae bacterium]|nr:neutral zinc metallopeptidase [Hyphomonadaceae bacterium]